jgi:hypothetical protein
MEFALKNIWTKKYFGSLFTCLCCLFLLSPNLFLASNSIKNASSSFYLHTSIPCPRTSFLLPLTSALALAPRHFSGDSTKSKYALTDPRNPDCPCHKYQKLADEEYARLLKNGKASDSNNKVRAEKISSETKYKRKLLRRHKRVGRKHGREKKQRKVWGCGHFR